MNKTLKQAFIQAYMWRHDCSEEDAKEAWVRMDSLERLTVIIAFEDNARRAF